MERAIELNPVALFYRTIPRGKFDMKAIALTVGLMILLICLAQGASAAPRLVIDGKFVELDTTPMIRSATVFVPLRGVFEQFKAQVSFDKKSLKVVAVKGKNTVVLVVGSNRAKVNGVQQIMPIPAFIYNNRTMVPLRFISESLGCEVKWEPGKSIVYIDSKGGSGQDNKTDDPDVDIKDPDDNF